MIRPKIIRPKVIKPTKLKKIIRPNLPKSYKTEFSSKDYKTESEILQDLIGQKIALKQKNAQNYLTLAKILQGLTKLLHMLSALSN